MSPSDVIWSRPGRAAENWRYNAGEQVSRSVNHCANTPNTLGN